MQDKRRYYAKDSVQKVAAHKNGLNRTNSYCSCLCMSPKKATIKNLPSEYSSVYFFGQGHMIIKYALSALLALPFLTSCLHVDTTSRLTAEVSSYGIWKYVDELDQVEKLKIKDELNGLALLEQTKDVPMKIGNIFIFKFRVYGPDGTYPTEMVQWHPELKDGQITVERISQPSEVTIKNGEFGGFWGHGLLEESHLIPGEWGYEIWHADKLLLSFEFTVE